MTRTAQSRAWGRKPTTPRWQRAGPLLVALVVIAALAAACGGGSSGAASSSPNGTGVPLATAQNVIRFDSCIRAHGFPDFPDSAVSLNGAGALDIHVPLNLKGDPQFQSAFQACQRDLPGGGPPAKHVNIQEELEYARCMRSHGITDFPDPMPGGGFRIIFNTNTPQFEAADHVCGAKFGK